MKGLMTINLNRGIVPLPNLEFKFIAANSLIGLPKANAGLAESHADIERLKELRDAYFTSHGDEKRQIEKKFKETQHRMFEHALNWQATGSQTYKLSEWNPFEDEASSWFDPEWMFGVRDGFDVVIANPPYLGESRHKEVFRKLKISSAFGAKYYQGKMDIFYFFFHLAIDLCKKGAQIAFITTNYYPTALGAKKLRNDFMNKTIIMRIVNFNELKVFESASGQHNMITLLKKDLDDNASAYICTVKRTGLATPELLQEILNGTDNASEYYSLKQKNLYEGSESYIRLHGNFQEGSDPLQMLLSKVKKQGELLGNVTNINQGVVSGCDYVSGRNIKKLTSVKNIENNDEIFVFNLENERDMQVLDGFSQIEKKLLRPFFKNSDIGRYWCKTTPTNLDFHVSN